MLPCQYHENILVGYLVTERMTSRWLKQRVGDQLCTGQDLKRDCGPRLATDHANITLATSRCRGRSLLLRNCRQAGAEVAGCAHASLLAQEGLKCGIAVQLRDFTPKLSTGQLATTTLREQHTALKNYTPYAHEDRLVVWGDC